MAVTITPNDTLVTGVSPDYVVQLDISDTVQYTESGNPITLYINDVNVEPYVDVFYSSNSGSPRTRIRVDYVSPYPWEPSKYYNVSLQYRDEEYNYTFQSTASAYKDTNSRATICPYSQKLGNSFPEYSRVRQEEFSVGQQFFHPFANQLDELNRNLWENQLNNTITNTQFRQIAELGHSRFYETYLSGYENLETILVTKTLKGQDQLTLTDINSVKDNSLRSAYLYEMADRFYVSSYQDLENINITSLSLAHQVYVHEYNFSVPTPLYVTIENGKGLLNKVGLDILEPTKITVRGLDRFNKKTIEEFKFVSNTTAVSSKLWNKIVSITVDSEATAGSVLLSKIPPTFRTQRDPKEWVWPSWNPDGGPVLWTIVQDPDNSNFILKCGFRPSPLIEVEALGATEKTTGNYDNPLNSQLYKEFILTDSNSNPITVSDFTIDFVRPLIYVLGEDAGGTRNLYIYHKHDEYPSTNVKFVEQKDFECPTQIKEFPNFGSTLRNGALDVTLDITYLQTRKVLWYEWSVLLPDGTRRFIDSNGNFQTTNGSCKIYNDYAQEFRLDVSPIMVTLSDLGLYQFQLFTKYLDGIESIDVRYFNVRSKTPLATYPIENLKKTNLWTWSDDQFFSTEASDSRNSTFGWRPGRNTVIDSDSTFVCNVPDSIDTAGLTFLVNNSTVSASFSAASNNAYTCTLSNLPVIDADSQLSVRVIESNKLNDEFIYYKSGDFTRIFTNNHGEIKLSTENGFVITLGEKTDLGIFDQSSNEFLTLTPYSRILVLE